MAMNVTPPDDDKGSANRSVLTKLGVVVVLMFGFGFALVPFYEQICRATGLRNIAQADAPANTQVDASRTVRVELDSNLRNLPWTFRLAGDVRVRASGRGAPGGLRSREHDRPGDHRAGDSQLQPAERRSLLPQARLLLLHAADAAAGRAPRDARRLRAGPGDAERHAYRVACRIRSSSSTACRAQSEKAQSVDARGVDAPNSKGTL
jgi:hypothetical protein